MTPEELGRIREIYERALPMSGPARDAFLEQESQGNTAIWREVERLLKAHDQVPSWLEQPFRAIATATMEGRRLSGYTLIREVGRGGMGSVYLAERSDGAIRSAPG